MSDETGSSGMTPPKILGIFALAMINVAAVLSIRNFPSMAEFGWSCIGWYIIGTILFLIPISLAGAELATMLSDKGGGVYAWCREAFGTKGGFVAIFCEWSNNLVWFPTVLAFVASTLAFAISPALANEPFYLFVVMMITFWGTTAIAYFGENVSSKFQNWGVILGSIIPSVIIIGAGIAWFASGAAIVLPPFSWGQVVPTINLSTLPFFATIILLFAGMEMAGFHALETRNPKSDYPKAMLFSSLIIFFCTVAATLAIAFVIPADQLSLAAGVMQAIQYFFVAAGIPQAVAPMAVLIAIGGAVSLAAWLIGPAKGLGVVAIEGNMPPVFNRHNRFGSPSSVLFIQAGIGTFISLLYVFLPSVNQAYWILSAMTVELLCIVYFFIFASVIKLRYSKPDAPRPFKIPGGKPGIWLFGGMGLFGVVFSFIVGLLPTGGAFSGSETIAYILGILIGTILLAVPPLIFLRLKKPGWVEKGGEQG
jgi:amino acid transporter